jgi:hypothetical protein
MTTTVVTSDSLELMTQLNAIAKELLEAAKGLREDMVELDRSTIKPALFTEKQASEYTGIAEQTLRTYRMTGEIGNGTPAPAFVKVGRSIFYEKAELDRWIKEDLPHFRKTKPRKETSQCAGS